MLNFIRKIDELSAWHCPHPCACVGPSTSTPKAYRYSTILAVPNDQRKLVAVAALSLTVSVTGGSIMLHRAWSEQPDGAQACDLVGQCFVARSVASGRAGDATIPLRAIGPWSIDDEVKRAVAYANIQAGADPAMAFLRQHGQSGALRQPEPFWHALQTQLVTMCAPLLAQGGQGP